MKLQEKTLRKYRQLFPHETLRETSARTGIQITRVFRLFNGKTMKVGELEAFESVINAKISENSGYMKLNQILEDASTIMSHDEFSKLAETLSRKLAIKAYSRHYGHSSVETASIA